MKQMYNVISSSDSIQKHADVNVLCQQTMRSRPTATAAALNKARGESHADVLLVKGQLFQNRFILELEHRTAAEHLILERQTGQKRHKRRDQDQDQDQDQDLDQQHILILVQSPRSLILKHVVVT